ncbi:MAG: bifunctional 3-deoxy-7-phosphoheptulonate synthase/chorismate mutase type II [Bacteroidales bacterium]|nr:bifunctional 3-deoxy-7-phosphoheptulonate synthase/chorismate mutase type II [Bacteroidales bacterium]
MTSKNKLNIIAGPCSVESQEQLLTSTQALCSLPQVGLIRAGVWKPRSRPGGFEGLGEQALIWMQELQNSDLRMSDGRPVRFCCEIARPEHVDLCLRHNIKNAWIGARTTTNPFMVEEICKALRGTSMTVMVKNPICPDVKLWVGAIERIQKVCKEQVVAIHRGFYTYDNHGFRNAPLWDIALDMRRHLAETPIFCDPSHMAGNRLLIEPLVHMALQLAYDGLFIEVHHAPDQALTDAQQQITPRELLQLLQNIEGINTNTGDTLDNALAMLRQQIDNIDHDLLHLLAQRMTISRQIAQVKYQHEASAYQPTRWQQVLDNRLQQASNEGLDQHFVKELMEKIHAESLRIQIEK